MWMAMFLIYLADIVNKLFVLFTVAAGIFGFSYMFLFVIYVMISVASDKDSDEHLHKIEMVGKFVKSKILIFILLFSISMAVLTPGKKVVYIAAGFYAGSLLVNSEQINSILGKSYEILDLKLDEILNETKENLKTE